MADRQTSGCENLTDTFDIKYINIADLNMCSGSVFFFLIDCG